MQEDDLGTPLTALLGRNYFHLVIEMQGTTYLKDTWYLFLSHPQVVVLF